MTSRRSFHREHVCRSVEELSEKDPYREDEKQSVPDGFCQWCSWARICEREIGDAFCALQRTRTQDKHQDKDRRRFSDKEQQHQAFGLNLYQHQASGLNYNSVHKFLHRMMQDEKNLYPMDFV